MLRTFIIIKEIERSNALAYPIKTAENKNVYWEEEVNGEIPENPKPQYLRLESESVAGTQTEITSEVKLRGRSPNEPLVGTESSSGSVATEFPVDEYDKWFAYVFCSEWKDKKRATLKITEVMGAAGTLTITLPDVSPVEVEVLATDTKAQIIEKICAGNYAPFVAKNYPFAPDVVEFDVAGDEVLTEDTISFDGGDSVVGEISTVLESLKEVVPSDITKTFYMMREYTQNPAKYQLFRGMKVNQLTMNCDIDSFVKLSWDLMGTNNPEKVDVSPVSLVNALDMFKTKSLTTMKGALKVNGIPNRQSSTFELTINNNMESTQALFEREAIESSLGDLEITGSVTEYFTTGELYNRAINGEKTPIEISFFDELSKSEYKFEIMTKFSAPTEDGDSKLSHTLAFNTFGNDRLRLTKRIKD